MVSINDLLWDKALDDRRAGVLNTIPQDLNCPGTQLSLIAVFVYDVEKGGFAQFVYNCQGLYLGETLELFRKFNAHHTVKHLEEVVQHCLTYEDEYHTFLSIDFGSCDFKNSLHAISIRYLKSDQLLEHELKSYISVLFENQSD